MALAITVALFHWFPAKGALAYYGARTDYLPAVGPAEVDVIAALRRGKPGIFVDLLGGVAVAAVAIGSVRLPGYRFRARSRAEPPIVTPAFGREIGVPS